MLLTCKTPPASSSNAHDNTFRLLEAIATSNSEDAIKFQLIAAHISMSNRTSIQL